MEVKKTWKVRKKAVLALVLFILIILGLGFTYRLKHHFPKELLVVNSENKEIGEMKTIKEKNKDYYKIFYMPKFKNKTIDQWVRKVSEENEALIKKENQQEDERIAYKQDYESYEVDNLISVGIHFYQDDKLLKSDIQTFDKEGKEFALSSLFKPEARRYLTHLIRENTPQKENMAWSQYLQENTLESFENFLINKEGIAFHFDEEVHFLDFKSHEHFLQKEIANFKPKEGTIPSVYLDRGVDKDQKLVAFTFDDGPHYENSLKLMDVLEEYNGQGTFFMVGQRVEGHEEIVKATLDRGHQLANHSFSHQNFNAIPQSEVEKEIKLANEAFEKASGYAGPYMIRPPYGNANETVLENNPYVFVNWSVDTLDWQTRDPNAICHAIENSAYDGAIILLHDLYTSSYEGFKCGIKKLHDAGYQFVTVEELLKAKEIDIQKNKLYFDAS